MMNTFYIIALAALIVFLFLMVLHMVRSKSIYDRMNALAVINSDVVILIVVFGFQDGRPEMYIDIAIAYAILGFVSNIVVAKYLGGKKNADK
jgi:multicomponent Na+:H+ antiporter subunit F